MCVALPALSLEINQIHTTFGLSSDEWPMSFKEIKERSLVLDNGKCHGDTSDMYVPNMDIL